ncbi:MAG: hypothetical protein WC022_01645 [Parcubacteria group bacterium]
MKIKSQKACLSLVLILFLLFSPFVLQAQTQDVNITNGSLSTDTNISGVSADLTDTVNGLISSSLDSLGVNKDTLSGAIGSFNVYSKKETPPQVSLIFSPSNPETGGSITATAIPTYFLNDSKDLYFTWFLRTKNCDGAEDSGKCDLNDDGRVDIEDYKIKAMRIIANNGFSWESADYSASPDGDSSFESTFGGNNQQGKTPYCYINDVGSGVAFPLECNTHFFPDAPHMNTGDGDFGRDEEKFWHTDPTSADTAQTGNTDEANVAGLGINSFTWTYSPGDEVGVVVEGVAVDPGKTEDSSFRTMWAAPKGMCHKTTIADGTMPNVSALNDCLYDNFTSPSENSPSSNKIEVSLSASPTSPINDPSSYSDPSLSNGDDLTVQSSITNATDSAYLQYSWQVFASDEANPDDWGSPIAKADLPEATTMEGLGLSSFKFKLNLTNPKKYLNVRLDVKENAEGDSSREGHASILIPLNSNGDTLSAFSTTTSGTSAPHISMADEICTSTLENAVCPIAKDAIVGVKLPSSDMTDFLWTIDGKPFTYSTCFFDGCDASKQSNVAYFPALKGVGSQYVVNLTATNKDNGEKINLSRTFQVVDPTISIASADESVCKPVQLGNYVDLKGKEWADYSSLTFNGISNNYIRLKAVAAGFTPSSDDLIWFVNGTAVTNDAGSSYGVDSSGVLTIPTGQAGSSYSISLQSTYSQNNPTKIALNKYWNVPYGQFYENTVSKSITVNIQDGTATTASAKSKKIIATIYTGIPAYLAFLLRIVLTAFLILFMSQLILMFFPEIKREN